ncbi:MAG TPA: DUF4426 domain-containing protein [Pseudomonadales bacterium]|nr:DUF4426 domain-containing protein [Pseudomonadales bacterium]HMV72289.1 DUF4426 domain-containing protein [Pseudomonadales bacterium]HNC70226.1 DUF4426 domain-containing protein [Pseudomonadales bacterium]HND13356.1 DUF4426 domain-containing protein [Pseudomonadales bacterium]
MKTPRHLAPLLALTLGAVSLLVVSTARAETRRFGAFEVHYSAFTSSFLQPGIAAAYGIVRGRDRAVLNVAVRNAAGSVEAQLTGTRSDLIRKEQLAFRAIREDGAIYYIAEFGFTSGETLYFDLAITPTGEATPLQLKFSQALHAD